MKKFFAHGAAKPALAFAGVTVILAISYELLPAEVLGDELSMIVALSVVAFLAVITALVRRLPRLRRVLRVYRPRLDAPDLRVCRLAALTSLVGLAVFVLFERGMPLAAVAAFVGVLLEEFIFRGVPLVFLLRAQDSPVMLWAIVVISSLTFTALHYSPLQIMYLDRFVFSCLAMLLAAKFDSLWPPLLYHALANVAAIVSERFLYNHAYAWVYIPLDVVLCAIVYLFCFKTSMRQVSQIGPVKVL